MLLSSHDTKPHSEWVEIDKLEKQNSQSEKRINKYKNMESSLLHEYDQLTGILITEYLKQIEFLSRFQQSNFHLLFNFNSMWQNFFSASYELNRKLFGY